MTLGMAGASSSSWTCWVSKAIDQPHVSRPLATGAFRPVIRLPAAEKGGGGGPG